MSFTFWSPPQLRPEQVSPMSALITRAMDTFGKGMNLAYRPKQLEADIFAKEIGPLAALASSPNFTGFNPQVQKMIASRISHYLGGGQGNESETGESTPGYASDQEIYQGLGRGADVALSSGGKRRVASSRLAGEGEKFGLPKAITDLLGGSKAAGENAEFEQWKSQAAKKLIFKGYSPQEAMSLVTEKPGEKSDAYKKRIKQLFISENPTTEAQSNEKQPMEVQETELKEPKGAKTLMETPDGQQWFVPLDQVQEAIRLGAKRVS